MGTDDGGTDYRASDVSARHEWARRHTAAKIRTEMVMDTSGSGDHLGSTAATGGLGASLEPASQERIHCRDINVFYGQVRAIHNVSMSFPDRAVTALIGPSGCGKSTFLRCLNRMNDTIETCRVTGEILIDGENINDPSVDPVLLRSRVGMVFQKPNPFPKSIFDNVSYGPRIHGLAKVGTIWTG